MCITAPTRIDLADPKAGKSEWPTYRRIQDYTEAVRVEFDPSAITYEGVLAVFFGELGGPPSRSSRQYRSAILYHSAEQMVAAQAAVAEYGRAHRLSKVNIDVEPATDFYRGEEYHQKYYVKNSVRQCGF